MKLSDLKSLIKEYGGPPISRKAYLKQKPMDPKLDEGRMKELHGYIERGMTAQQIAKKMKLDVKTIKALMPESVDEGLKDGYIVYKKMGISKIKKVATLKTMPKGKMLDKVLDKYNADGVIAMSKVLRNKMQVEAVSPAQQAAIAIAKKEKGEKPEIKETAWVDLMLAGIVGAGMMGGLAFIMGYTAYDVYQTDYRGRGLDKKLRQKFSDLKAKLKNKNYRPSKKDIETAKELGKEGKTQDPSAHKKAEVKVNKIKKDSKTKLKESRAYRDAMRGLRSRSATRGMATTKKDKDISATDDDRKAASKNIIMQLRKAADLTTGAEVEFERGKGKVTRAQAQGALARFNALSKPNEKEKFQKSIKSLADIKKILGR